MKILKLSLIAAIAITLISSCGGGTSKQKANAEGFGAIEKELKSKFGEDAFYTDLSITYNESIGNIIGVTVTENPESLKMGQWNLTQYHWQQNSDITIEIPKGTKASDYMFQLKDKVSLSELGKLVEQSQEKLSQEKQISDSKLHMAFVNYPDNGDVSNAEYTVMLQPKNGGTTFTFRYSLRGDFIEMDY